MVLSQVEDSTTHVEDQVVIAKVFLSGNKITKERIIRRELSFVEGETWTPEELATTLEQDQRKLQNLRLFNSVKVEMVPVDPKTVDIIIQMDERWYIWPNLIFDLSDRSFNEWWYNQNRDLNRIEYGGSLDWLNVRGANERLSLKAQFGFNKKLRLAYRFPYIDQEQKTGLSLEASYTTSNAVNYQSLNNEQAFFVGDTTLYSDLYFAATVSRRPDFYNTHYFIVTYNDRMVGDTIGLLNPNFFLGGAIRQQFFRVTYQFTHDQRDGAYPLVGQYGQVGIQQQGLGIMSSFSRTQLYFNFAKYWQLHDKHPLFFANRISGRTSFPSLQPYNLFQALGFGKDFVRGYERKVIEGQHFVLNKTNFKYRILRKQIDLGKWMPLAQFRKIPIDIYAKVYLDQGYVWNSLRYDGNRALINKYLVGTGFGLDFVTWYDTVFRFEYSRNGEDEWGFYFGLRADL